MSIVQVDLVKPRTPKQISRMVKTLLMDVGIKLVELKITGTFDIDDVNRPIELTCLKSTVFANLGHPMICPALKTLVIRRFELGDGCLTYLPRTLETLEFHGCR
jgi:hypothetical protein